MSLSLLLPLPSSLLSRVVPSVDFPWGVKQSCISYAMHSSNPIRTSSIAYLCCIKYTTLSLIRKHINTSRSSHLRRTRERRQQQQQQRASSTTSRSIEGGGILLKVEQTTFLLRAACEERREENNCCVRSQSIRLDVVRFQELFTYSRALV